MSLELGRPVRNVIRDVAWTVAKNGQYADFNDPILDELVFPLDAQLTSTVLLYVWSQAQEDLEDE